MTRGDFFLEHYFVALNNKKRGEILGLSTSDKPSYMIPPMDHGVLFRLSGPRAYEPKPDRGVHWASIDAVLRGLIMLFVTPALLLSKGFTEHAVLTGFVSLLREGEAAARAALLRDAQAISVDIVPRKTSVRRAGGAPIVLANDFRAWPASLRMSPRGGSRGGDRCQPSRAEIEFARMMAPYPPPYRDYERDAFELARARISLRASALRYEALRRVCENPAPFALRLAKRLRRREAARLANTNAAREEPLRTMPDREPSGSQCSGRQIRDRGGGPEASLKACGPTQNILVSSTPSRRGKADACD